ncbi:MAG: PIN domain-containing protein [Thermoanaerobaculia bacterium]
MAAGERVEPGIHNEGEVERLRADALVVVDKSAWEQRRHSRAARERIDQLATAGRAATCLPVALEQLYSARNHEDLTKRREALDLLVWLPITAAVEEEALDLMARLARKGQHRIPLPDIMIAATAVAHGATILHYDRDFERIAETTGQLHEWILPPGSGHGRDEGDGP